MLKAIGIIIWTLFSSLIAFDIGNSFRGSGTLPILRLLERRSQPFGTIPTTHFHGSPYGC
jgi:hypothetical protein